jgi:N-acetylmuramoyl-L-alanine amidase
MSTGQKCLDIARQHIGERYVLGSFVPKNLAHTKGPWDCAEFVSWCVFQVSGVLYGCTPGQKDPARADAFTGYWEEDSRKLGIVIPAKEAAGIAGAVLLRYPTTQRMGHIVFADGKGGTVEAKSTSEGVKADTLSGRLWNIGILVPGLYYGASNAVRLTEPRKLLGPGLVNSSKLVLQVQQRLSKLGYEPGPADGIYGVKTAAAVRAFQIDNGLVADGMVGPQTAAALPIKL